MSAVVRFLHIPKTGGTYVARGESPALSSIMDYNHSVVVPGEHPPEAQYPPTPGYRREMVVPYATFTNPIDICFSIVRNPFDWFVSYWHHAGALIPENLGATHYDYLAARRGFDYLVRTVAERETSWPCRKLIHFAIFAYHGPLVVDYLLHQDALDEELGQFAGMAHVPYQKSDPAMVSDGRRADYRTYYSDDLVSVVKDVWGRELQLFGYSFESGRVEGGLPIRISKKYKQNLRYRWDEDKLTFFGKEFCNEHSLSAFRV